MAPAAAEKASKKEKVEQVHAPKKAKGQKVHSTKAKAKHHKKKHMVYDTRSAAGDAYVVFGATGIGANGLLKLGLLNGTNGFVLHGVDASDFSSRSVSSAGDVNGDGFDDVVIGAVGGDPRG